MIQEKNLLSALNVALDETFENVVGIYLDRGDSLFTTLDGIFSKKRGSKTGRKE